MTTVRACLLALLAACVTVAPAAAAGRALEPGPEAGPGRDTAADQVGTATAVSWATLAGSTERSGRARSARSNGRSSTDGQSAAASKRTKEPRTGQGVETGPDSPLRILFIGNSHTDRHGGMDWLVRNLAASEDPARQIVTERLVGSGVTLEYHIRNGALRRIRDGDWDIVVLQEYLPGSPTRSPAPFYRDVRVLDEAIRDAGARTVLYMTWPERLHPWASLDDISSAHRLIATELGTDVAPVGLAMQRAHDERPDLTFLDWDGVHTTWEGAYLAAATIYAALFERSPEGLPYHLGIGDADAAYLQRVAWQTVDEWRAGSGDHFAAVAAGPHPVSPDVQVDGARAAGTDDQPKDQPGA